MYNILLVEDNSTIQETNKALLEEVGGYSVSLAMNLNEARQRIMESVPDLIVLDVLLPDGNGLDLLKELKQTMDTPVLFLTALSESGDEIKCIKEGGDDYIAKPYKNSVLLVRIEKILNQKQKVDERIKTAVQHATGVMEYGPLTVNNITKRAYLSGVDAKLTPKEFSLLTYFLGNVGRHLTAKDIYEEVWGQDAISQVDTVKVHIKELRKKLHTEDEIAVVIETISRTFYVCYITT